MFENLNKIPRLATGAAQWGICVFSIFLMLKRYARFDTKRLVLISGMSLSAIVAGLTMFWHLKGQTIQMVQEMLI